MPVCSYIVIPQNDVADDVESRLASLPGCDVVRAENRDVLLLVTDTPDAEREQALLRELEAVPGILSLTLTFGDLAGTPMTRIDGRRRRDGAA